MADSKADTAKSLITVVMESRPLRAFKRYGAGKGGLLAGGIAYSALFSIVSALTIAWTIFMATLGKNPSMQNQVIDAVNKVLPDLLKDSSGKGMVDPNALILDRALNPVSLLAGVVALWTAISIMSNIRTGIQAMFGIVAPAENMVQQKLRDLFGFIGMAIGIVASAVLGTAASTMGGTVLNWLNLADNPVAGFLVRVLGLVVAVIVSMVTFAALFRVTAAVRPVKRDLWLGSALGGVAVQAVLMLGTRAVSSVSDNPLLAASAGLASLLLFVNLLSRILMLVAAFTANPPTPVTPHSPQEVHFKETPNFVTLSAPHTLKWEYQDVSGQVEPDPSLRPGSKKAAKKTPQMRPDGKPMYAEELGMVQRTLLKRKAHKLELEAVKIRARLGQRPLIEAAEREYWQETDKANREERESQEHADLESRIHAEAVGATSAEADHREDNTTRREHVMTKDEAEQARREARESDED